MLFSSFTSSYFFHNSHFCSLLFHRGHKHIPVVRFAAAQSLPPPCVSARAQRYHGDTGSFTSRHLTLSHRSHTRIKTGIPPFIAPSLTYQAFAPFHQYLNLHPRYDFGKLSFLISFLLFQCSFSKLLLLKHLHLFTF